MLFREAWLLSSTARPRPLMKVFCCTWVRVETMNHLLLFARLFGEHRFSNSNESIWTLEGDLINLSQVSDVSSKATFAEAENRVLAFFEPDKRDKRLLPSLVVCGDIFSMLNQRMSRVQNMRPVISFAASSVVVFILKYSLIKYKYIHLYRSMFTDR